MYKILTIVCTALVAFIVVVSFLLITEEDSPQVKDVPVTTQPTPVTSLSFNPAIAPACAAVEEIRVRHNNLIDPEDLTMMDGVNVVAKIDYSPTPELAVHRAAIRAGAIKMDGTLFGNMPLATALITFDTFCITELNNL